jgi:hypothetical protein
MNCQKTIPVCRVEENEDILIRGSNVLAILKREAYVSQTEILSNARFCDYPESHVALASLLADQTVSVSLLLSAGETPLASMSAVCTTFRKCLLVDRSASH